MAGNPIPISQLPLAGPLTGSEVTVLVQGGKTVQAPLEALSAVGGAIFSSVATAAATTLPANLVGLSTEGFATPGDGGASFYLRSDTRPDHPGYFQSADGAFWVYASPTVNVIAFGVEMNAVQNPDGSWTGTDNTAAFANAELTRAALGLSGTLPRGACILSGTVTVDTHGDGFQESSNVSWLGERGGGTVIVDKNTTGGATTALFKYGGVADVDTSVLVYLTANIAVGDLTAQVNDSSLLEPNQYVCFIDHSQVLYDDHDGAVICNVGFPNRIKTIVDSTHVTLYGQAEFALVANAGAPLQGTTIKRFTAPIQNVLFQDIAWVTDPTLTYPNTSSLLQVRRFVGAKVLGCDVTMLAPTAGITSFLFQEGFYATVAGGNTQRDNIDAYSIKAPGCFYCQFYGSEQGGGRHTTDSGPTSANGIESAHCDVYGMIAPNTESIAFQSHPGTRNWSWSNCKAVAAGGTGSTGNCGFQGRGRFNSMKLSRISGYDYGIYIPFSQDIVVSDCEIDNCKIALAVALSDRVLFRDIVIDGVTQIAISVGTAVTIPPAGQDPRVVKDITFERITVRGNPSIAVVQNTAGLWDPSWSLIDIRAPYATTFFVGVPANYDWPAIGSITTGTVTVDPLLLPQFSYKNNGAHVLAPSGHFGRVTVDIINGASAGAIDTTLWTKVSGDVIGTSLGGQYRCEAVIGPVGPELSVVDMSLHQSLWTTLQVLGFGAQTQFCLDAGDGSCYPGTGTTLTDLAGVSTANFTAGASVAFHGIENDLSPNEYFTLPGNAAITYAGSNTAWMNALHKNTEAYTLLLAVYLPGPLGSAFKLGGTSAGAGANSGISWGSNGGVANANLVIDNATGTIAYTSNSGSSTPIIAPGWNFFALTYDPAGNCLLYVNDASHSDPVVIPSPSAAAASFALQLCADGNNHSPLPINSRFGMGAGLLGALSTDQIASIFSRVRQRYGI